MIIAVATIAAAFLKKNNVEIYILVKQWCK